MIEKASDLKIDTKKIAILGDSAGGNLAAATTLRARDEGLPMPRCQMLIYPVVDRRMQTKSMKCYTDTPVWDAKLSKLMWELYLKNVVIQEEKDGGKGQGEQEFWLDGIVQPKEAIAYFSPTEAENLSGLPYTYVEVAEFDCLRDEGIAFAKKLNAAGVLVELHRVFGSVHGYDVVMHSDTVKKMMRRRVKKLKEHLV